MSWLDQSLGSPDGHKFIIVDHIYAGARIEHNDKEETFNLWNPDYNDQYFSLWEKHQKNIIMEIAGHDHWQDIRLDNHDSKKPLRNVFISGSFTMKSHSYPEFSTLKIDMDTLKPHSLV